VSPRDAHAQRVEVADWLEGVGTLEPGSIDLLYADPPFNTGATKASPPRTEAVTGRAVFSAYADAWPDMASYVAWLRQRLAASLPALRDTACILLHVDWRTSHHARLVLDELLGADCFVNHLIWTYGLGGSSPRRFARKHDDILFYSRRPDGQYFEPPTVPATSQKLKGRMKKATDVIRIAEEPAGDLLDVASLNNMARERTGYPTQKPLALLELLVKACCPPEGVVLDPCCGSGTTLVAAVRLGRRAVGFDVSPDAVALAQRRLHAAVAQRE